MNRPIDEDARNRFIGGLDWNFAVNANAGSGKTTAIAGRLAALALAPGAREVLPRTAVVTFTRKAALEIRQRARQALVTRLAEDPGRHEGALEELGRVFFGTIHSFCLLLARRYGQPLGVDLDPEVIEDATDSALWESFLETDPMSFQAVSRNQLRSFLRFRTLDTIFELAQTLPVRSSRRLRENAGVSEEPEPDWTALNELLGRAPARRGKSAGNLEASQRALARWGRAFREEEGYLPMIKPLGRANGVEDSYERFFAPLKHWCAGVAGLLAAELAERYRLHRMERRVQSYDDQIELAMRLIEHPEVLERIRRDGYRILLDEAQDTDPGQFRVLVEIARPPGAAPGSWPGAGAPPEPGRFCMVGDAQQSIYGGRADVRNYQRHLEAFEQSAGCGVLNFSVTFRLPGRLIDFMNRAVAPGFAETVGHNRSSSGGCLQVPYLPLAPRPAVSPGQVSRLVYAPSGDRRVDQRLRVEQAALAGALARGGPGGVGAGDWSEVCLLAPRRDWLETARECLAKEGITAALQTRASRNGDRPAFAWIAGLLAIIVDPENGFEWAGVLREIFGISDAVIAESMSGAAVDFSNPEDYPPEVGAAIERIRPSILKCDEPGVEPVRFLDALVRDCRLVERFSRIEEGDGAIEDLEAIRLMAEMISEEGGGVRELQVRLVVEVEKEAPSGRAGDGSLNLLTCHSGKGLEWPVVIPIGLWRPLARPTESGFALVDDSSASRVYFEPALIPEDTRNARGSELTREHMRLLYVTLTRARRHLLLPLPEGLTGDEGSFLDIWAGGRPEQLAGELERLPDLEPSGRSVAPMIEQTAPEETGREVEAPTGEELARARAASQSAPRRSLPHELAKAPDQVRMALHEAGSGDIFGGADSGDPIDYGLWWHETMEYLPWTSDRPSIGRYLETRLTAASGEVFHQRACREIGLLRESELWTELAKAGGTMHTEVAVFAPAEAGGWIDGILDFLLLAGNHEDDLVIDWKTNRRRGGESDAAMLDRLTTTYAPQLAAYSRAIGQGLGRGVPRARVYSTVLGSMVETVNPGA